MTTIEELKYLQDLQHEALLWNLDAEEDINMSKFKGYHLEINTRIKCLLDKLDLHEQVNKPAKVPSLKRWRYLHRAELVNLPEGVVLAKYHEAVTKPSLDIQGIAEEGCQLVENTILGNDEQDQDQES